MIFMMTMKLLDMRYAIGYAKVVGYVRIGKNLHFQKRYRKLSQMQDCLKYFPMALKLFNLIHT